MSLTPPSAVAHSNQSPTRHPPLLRLVVPVLWFIAGLSLSLSACGSHQAGSRSTPVAASTVTATTEVNTPTSPPSATQTWIPLHGQTAAAVLAAVRQSAVFQMVMSAPKGSDGYFDLSRLDAPVLVVGYGTNKEGGSVNAPDYYEIPARSSAGLVDAVISAELNTSHTAISVGSVSSTDPTPTWPGKLVGAGQAVQIVQDQRHTVLRPGTHAQLFYLAAYNYSAVETGQLTWQAGGAGPQNPIWLVPGADGQTYFVGTDSQSYTLAELPLQ